MPSFDPTWRFLRPIIVECLMVMAVVGVCALGLEFSPVVRLVENWLWDVRIAANLTPSAPVNSDVVVVTITEDTLAQFPYRSPIDRGWLADLLEAIDRTKPTALGIDILFDQPTERAKDERLRQVLTGLTVPTVVAAADGDGGLTPQQSSFLRAFLPADGPITPAWANMFTDRDDGIVRRIFPGKQTDAGWKPAFVPALVAQVGGRAPLVAEPFAMLPFTEERPLGALVYPAESVPLLPREWLAGKIVLVGFDLPLADRHRSAAIALHGTRMGTVPGVILHAHAIAHLLSGNRLVVPSWGWQMVVVAGMGLLGAVAARIDLPAAPRIASVIGLLLLFWGGAFVLIGEYGVILPMFIPSVAFVLAAGAISTHLWRTARQQKAFVETAFSRYVSPSIVAELTRDPGKLMLGGEVRDITYLFTDIAGFTALAECTPPHQLCCMLNEYLDGMTRLFLEHRATIDKIVGDAVVGFFNAPVDQPDHASRGVRLALAIDAYAEDFRLRQNLAGVAMGKTRVGVHTGPATVGNFGGSYFFNYTGHGDTVNTAARLEGANKYLGTRLCVSAATASQCHGISFRPIGNIILKGKSKYIEAFEPVPDDFVSTQNFLLYLRAYESMALSSDDSAELFSTLSGEFPHDSLSSFHNDRLKNGKRGVLIELMEK